MIAALELVRIYLRHSRETDNDPAASPPSFEDFRGTVELLDRRSKAFIHQAADLVAELRRFGHNVSRINRARFITHCLFVGLGALAGVNWIKQRVVDGLEEVAGHSRAVHFST